MGVSLPVRRETAAWLLVGAIVAAFAVYVVWSLVGAVLVGLFLYYATRPVYRRLDERSEHPDLVAATTLALVSLPMLAIVIYAGLVGLQELNRFLTAANLEELRSLFQPYLDVSTSLDRQSLLALLRGNFSLVQSLVAAIGLWLLRLFVILAFAFYLLRDDHKIAGWFRSTFADYPAAIAYAEAVDDDLDTLYTGNLLTIAATGLIAVVVFYALNLLAPTEAGIAYPILLGLVIGVATLVPAFGMKIVYFPYAAYLLWRSLQSGGPPIWFPVVFFVVTLLVVDSFPDIFVRSYISKGELNMGLVMLSYVLGAVAFGWYGIFFAPVILIASVHFARDIVPWLLGNAEWWEMRDGAHE